MNPYMLLFYTSIYRVERQGYSLLFSIPIIIIKQ
jgi:hypothetical protein